MTADAQAVRAWAGTLTGLPLDEPALGCALRRADAQGLLALALPGGGATLERWFALAEYGAADLSLGRLVEAHADAVAVLHELAGPAAAGLYGLWAAEPPDAVVHAAPATDGWVLRGRKAWCSGARILDRALVSAHAPDGRRLFVVETADLEPLAGTWSAVGMAASGSVSVHLAAVRGVPVGAPGAYLTRPGFWHGAAGVAACWFGGALGVGRTLLARSRERDLDPHALAHLGAVDTVLSGLADLLRSAAAEIDADPADRSGAAELRARRVRASVEAGAAEVLDRVGRALGPAPLCLDAVHAQRAADLPVYLRQSHAERDLADLGRLAAQQARWSEAAS